ncbi:hypothetical protein ACFLYP_03925 [Chloroflexota bacterium]
MLDDLQGMTDTSAFLDELEDEEKPKPSPKRRSRRSMRILGMTPIQMFVISIELFLMVCILGFFFLIITDKMVLPI